MWIIYVIGFYTLAVVSTLTQRRIAAKTQASLRLAPAIGYVFGVWPFGILISLTMERTFTVSAGAFLSLMAIMVTMTAANYLGYLSLRHNDVAQHQVLGNISFITTLVGGALFLHEILTTMQYIAAALILLGVISIELKKKFFQLRVSSLYALGAGVTFGLGLVAEKWSLEYMSLGSYFLIGYGVQAIGLALFAIPHLKERHKVTRKHFAIFTLIGLLGAMQGYMYINALVLANNISLVSVATSFTMIPIFIASYTLLGERQNLRRKLLGLTLATLGIMLLAL